MRKIIAGLLLVLLATPALAERAPPYWASLRAGEVMMRKGPGRNFPASWLYRRNGLPVKVLENYVNAKAVWRKIEDPDGTQGWVQANLVSDQRTAIVTGDIRPLRERPDGAANIAWRAEPGVVGKISQCGNGWCMLDVGGKTGFVEIGHIAGVSAEEQLP